MTQATRSEVSLKRYKALRRKLRKQGRPFAGIRIINSHTVGDSETLPRGHRGISWFIGTLTREDAWSDYTRLFTNMNDEVVFDRRKEV